MDSEDFSEGADIIIDATGVPSVFRQTIQLRHARPWDPLVDGPGIRCVIQGGYEDDLPVPCTPAYAGQVSVSFPRGSQVDDWKQTLALLSNKRIRIADPIRQIHDPEAAESIYAELKKPDTKLVMAIFCWN
jgi:threonine dehydrogenase-like Zn-dependent dehydrogenase